MTSIHSICYPQLMHDHCVHIPHFPPLQPPSCVATSPNAEDVRQAMQVIRCPMFVTGNSRLSIADAHSHILYRSQTPEANTSNQFIKARQRNWSVRGMLSTQYQRSKQTAGCLVSLQSSAKWYQYVLFEIAKVSP